MNFRTQMLPRLVLIGAIYCLATAALNGALLAMGWTGMAESAATLAVSALSTAAKASFLLALAVAARSYYLKDGARLVRVMPALRAAMWVALGLMCAEWTMAAVRTLGAAPVAPGLPYRLLILADLLRLPAFLAGMLLIVDLLEECVFLRDEAAGTV